MGQELGFRIRFTPIEKDGSSVHLALQLTFLTPSLLSFCPSTVLYTLSPLGTPPTLTLFPLFYFHVVLFQRQWQ